MFLFPRLYAVVDAEICTRRGLRADDVARAFLAGGVRLLQLRVKDLSGAAFLDLAMRIAEQARAAGAALVVNDRADIAVLSGAAGVHVGQDDLTAADVRVLVGPDRIVGLSTHTTEQMDRALAAPITYFAIGPIFSTATKATGYEPVGYAAVNDASRRAAAANLPVVAIGGITLESAPRVIEAGAAAVAVITDLLTADPEARVRQYLAALR